MPAGKLLLIALALEVQALTGWEMPPAELPGLTLVAEVDLAIASGTGHHSAGKITGAVYVPEWNVIFAEQRLLEDPDNFQAILIHELVHWFQHKSKRPTGQWEAEAKRLEAEWRKTHGGRKP